VHLYIIAVHHKTPAYSFSEPRVSDFKRQRVPVNTYTTCGL